jgi:hypothetical protein
LSIVVIATMFSHSGCAELLGIIVPKRCAALPDGVLRDELDAMAPVVIDGDMSMVT